ncbi:MAG: tetratricopeptide repeat protein, partial [Candidatus Saccharimonadales bacterium]
MPKGLEFAQKATDADIVAVRDAKQLIAEKGLDVSTAIKAISLSKQKHSTVDQSLQELGWAPTTSGGSEHLASSSSSLVAPRSQFDRSQLDAIGRKTTGEVAGLTARFGQPVTNITTSETAKPNFDPKELDAIKPEEDLSRKSLTGLKAIAAAQTARVNPIAALGSTQPVSAAVPAGKRDHSELLSEADHAFSKQNYELAESLYVQALNALECKPDSTLNEVSDVLFKTGKACVQLKDFARAEQYFSRALKIRELHSGPSMAVAECLDQMAQMYEAQDHLQQAEQCYVSSLTVKERVLASGSPEVAAALKNLVAVIKRKGPHPEEKLSGELFAESGMI